MYFDDGVRRIDYILSWSTKKEDKVIKEDKDDKDAESMQRRKQYRETFEKNLQVEGLQLEYDIKVLLWFACIT